MDYQDPEDQEAIQKVQLAVILIQLGHGNGRGISKVIHEGKQGKHLVGHNNYVEGKSILTENAQELLNDFHAGKISSSEVINEVKTRVDFWKDNWQSNKRWCCYTNNKRYNT